MPSVRAFGLAFAHGDAAPILDHLDLHLTAGFTGLVGPNGAGKTTLLRLLAGALAPDAGRVRIEPEPARVAYCQQTLEAPGEGVLALATRQDREAQRARDALRLDAASLARWETLSPGERRRWQVAAALACDPDVLLLDEPTNHLDAPGRALLVGALRGFHGVGLIVSHDRALLEALTDRTLRLQGGAARLYAGAYGAARAQWEREERAGWDARAAAQAEARRAAARLDDARRTQASAEASRSTRARMKGPRDHDARTLPASTRAAWAEARAGRSVELARRQSERARAAIPEAPPDRALGRSLFLGWERAPRPWLLELDAPALRAGGRAILRDVKVRLGREDRLRLAGPNGAGKTTLLHALLATSTLPPERVLFLPQELAPGEGLAALAALRATPPDVRGRVLSLVAALGVDPARLLASRDPSPGESRKLLLALGLGRHAWALVLDEPTNHLDLPAVERLEEALEAYPGAILLVTHDDALAARCTSTTLDVTALAARPDRPG